MKNVIQVGSLVTFTSIEESSSCCGADITGGCGDGIVVLCKSCYEECSSSPEEVTLTQEVVATGSLSVTTVGGHVLTHDRTLSIA
tara:strand:+ start:726 stop:980 length:255 start_codon:yes stop_codon:yes gene_type:complete